MLISFQMLSVFKTFLNYVTVRCPTCSFTAGSSWLTCQSCRDHIKNLSSNLYNTSMIAPDTKALVFITGAAFYLWSGLSNPIRYDSLTYNDVNNPLCTECSICITPFEPSDIVVHTRCRHTFHKDCISSWYGQGNRTCPNCRRDVEEPD